MELKLYIPFNKPCITGNEEAFLHEVIQNKKFSGDGEFNNKCSKWLEEYLNCTKAFLTPSCTHALEMSAILANIQKDDEVIMPSYTFPSTANAFALRGAKIVFIDIRPDTQNIDENLIEPAITSKTKAIVVVHYAGVSCEMDKIMSIANRNNLIVIEDAAQAIMSTYKNKFLGTFGHFGCFSFHETKNFNCGEGGALIINDERFVNQAEILREKGTNRTKFFRGEINKYTWVDIGSSYLLSELNAAFLYAQFQSYEEIYNDRINSWNLYFNGLKELEESGKIQLPFVPGYCKQNGHMFYIKTRSLEERTNLINFLKTNNVMSVFHFIPLHSSEAGIKFGRLFGSDNFSTSTSEQLLRLPMYYKLSRNKIHYIVELIKEFYNEPSE